MFISRKTEELTKEYASKRAGLGNDEQALFDSMVAVMHELAAQVDMLSLKADELAEQIEDYTYRMEDFASTMQTIKDRIVGDIPVETPFADRDGDDEHDGCDCDCEDDDCHCHDTTPVTLQCSYCEEIFIADADTASKGIATCPFCDRQIIVRDCLVE